MISHSHASWFSAAVRVSFLLLLLDDDVVCSLSQSRISERTLDLYWSLSSHRTSNTFRYGVCRRPGIWWRLALAGGLGERPSSGSPAARPPRDCVWKPSSAPELGGGTMDGCLGLLGALAAARASTSSMWRVSMERRGPAWDCQWRLRRGRRGMKPGARSL